MKSIFLIDDKGNHMGQADYTRWSNAKPYHRFLGCIFKRYKNRFIDVKGFEVEYKNPKD